MTVLSLLRKSTVNECFRDETGCDGETEECVVRQLEREFGRVVVYFLDGGQFEGDEGVFIEGAGHLLRQGRVEIDEGDCCGAGEEDARGNGERAEHPAKWGNVLRVFIPSGCNQFVPWEWESYLRR